MAGMTEKGWTWPPRLSSRPSPKGESRDPDGMAGVRRAFSRLGVPGLQRSIVMLRSARDDRVRSLHAATRVSVTPMKIGVQSEPPSLHENRTGPAVRLSAGMTEMGSGR
jgi:hypothetical protein